MKISINISKETKKSKFPGLYLSKGGDSEGLVVFFATFSSGIVVSSDSQDWKVGGDSGFNCYEDEWTYLPAGSTCTFTQE